MFRLKLDDNLERDTFTYREETSKHKHGYDYFFEKEPAATMFLVRVKGRTGGSDDTYDTSWEVEVFHDLAAAEALADKIDFQADLYHALYEKWSNDTIAVRLSKAPDGRIKLIQGLARLYRAMDGRDARIYLEGQVMTVEYEFEGKTLRHHGAWFGHFEDFYQVEVVPIALEGTRRRWRDHRR